jgi:hypothetical protein
MFIDRILGLHITYHLGITQTIGIGTILIITHFICHIEILIGIMGIMTTIITTILIITAITLYGVITITDAEVVMFTEAQRIITQL